MEKYVNGARLCSTIMLLLRQLCYVKKTNGDLS